jgi:anti-anti-sigma regulatory factor
MTLPSGWVQNGGARAIVRAHKRASDSGAELRLVVTAKLVRRMFDLIGVDHLLDIYLSVEAAARGVAPNGSIQARG